MSSAAPNPQRLTPPALQNAVPLPANFNPDLTLCGGQAFRWVKSPTQPTYQGVIGEQVVNVSQTSSGGWYAYPLTCPLTATLRQQLWDYFDLDRDYVSLHHLLVERLTSLQEHYRQHFQRSPWYTLQPPPPTSPFANLSTLLSQLAGLRLLRQPWFEVMVSFVVSANNHLPRIRQIISIISRTFGQPISPTAAAFPTPAALATATPTTLRHVCRVGYRDRYLYHLARHIARHLPFWETAASLPTPALRHHLLTLPGVGPKVAECILLFGFHRWEAFPIDVWVRRALLLLLGWPPPPAPQPTNRYLAALAADAFGPCAGLAQQYLFEIARHHLPPKQKTSPKSSPPLKS